MNAEKINDGIRPKLLILTIVAVVVILVGMFLLSPNRTASKGQNPQAVSTPDPAPATIVVKSTKVDAPAPASTQTPVERDWGIRVSKLALVRESSAIDLHYEIVAPEKVGLIGTGINTAYLIDMDSGTQYLLTTPPEDRVMPGSYRANSRARAMRLAGEFPPPAGRILAGKTYSALLPNPMGNIKIGSTMALVIGTSRVDNLIVE